MEHNAEYAQNLAISNCSAKEPDLKIGHDRILEKAIIHYIKDLISTAPILIAHFREEQIFTVLLYK